MHTIFAATNRSNIFIIGRQLEACDVNTGTESLAGNVWLVRNIVLYSTGATAAPRARSSIVIISDCWIRREAKQAAH